MASQGGGISSDPGVGKSARTDMVSFSRAVSEFGVRGMKPENKKEEQEYSSKREGYSPVPGTLKEQAEAKRGSPSKHHDPDLDHAPDHVRPLRSRYDYPYYYSYFYSHI